eukprot:Seg422.6 transcript_id=Seg422.6/GoldUCD/mRNA.D3Y31 product="Spore wall maturation protein DIT1" protein_id=Seg422.6/GoldUCD/D3Y31
MILDIVLDNWMHGYGYLYSKTDYENLRNCIFNLVVRELPLRFFLPGFPSKSSNNIEKVFGARPDFAEFLAIRSLLTTARKLQAIYNHGVVVTILSDYHTFDEYVGVNEEDYFIYHHALQEMIHDSGADDVIELISLSNFPEFKNVPTAQISTVLRERFGDYSFLASFDDEIKANPAFFERYKQLRKFMLKDRMPSLPSSKGSKATRSFLKKVTRGMMEQGVALDRFLKQQTTIRDFIRLSIHHHNPHSGKYPIDLFKNIANNGGILRTPWHHVVCFDTFQGKFVVDQKTTIESIKVKNSCLLKVKFNGNDWMYVRLHIEEKYFKYEKTSTASLHISIMRGGCGIMIENHSIDESGEPLDSNCIMSQALSSLVEEFGIVVLRGFKKFESEEHMIVSYSPRLSHGMVKWDFGYIHKVKPSDTMPGITCSYEGLPMHIDLMAPPRYMNISQEDHKYDDFVPREFLLYCKETDLTSNEGQTTFVDSNAAIMALNGKVIEQWRKTVLSYETQLSHPNKKAVYFGGKGNVYQYPLVMKCPWTGKDVLRWWQLWTAKEHPDSRQYSWHDITASPEDTMQTAEDLEDDIKNIAFDERFFFGHTYAIGDQVYVNNYTMLHGRQGFANNRELWRIQAVPPSNNTPAYYAENAFLL